MSEITYIKIDNSIVQCIAKKFGDYIIKYNCFHFDEGCFSMAAFYGKEPVGFLSVYPKTYPTPLSNINDAYIDVIEVEKAFQRQGIAKEMIRQTEEWAKTYGYSQIRAWSSNDKLEAIHMWYTLGYCICPAKIWVEWCKEIVDGFYVAKKFSNI